MPLRDPPEEVSILILWSANVSANCVHVIIQLICWRFYLQEQDCNFHALFILARSSFVFLKVRHAELPAGFRVIVPLTAFLGVHTHRSFSWGCGFSVRPVIYLFFIFIFAQEFRTSPSSSDRRNPHVHMRRLWRGRQGVLSFRRFPWEERGSPMGRSPSARPP